MTGTPKFRSREEQKEELALRMTIGFPSMEVTMNNAEAHIAEAEARALASQGGEPVGWLFKCSFDAGYRFSETQPKSLHGYRIIKLHGAYTHPDPLLAAKEAEIAELRAELDRLRKPEWFADPEDPENFGWGIDDILDNRGDPEGEIIALDGYRRTGSVWVFRLNGLDYQFDSEAEAVSALERREGQDG